MFGLNSAKVSCLAFVEVSKSFYHLNLFNVFCSDVSHLLFDQRYLCSCLLKEVLIPPRALGWSCEFGIVPCPSVCLFHGSVRRRSLSMIALALEMKTGDPSSSYGRGAGGYWRVLLRACTCPGPCIPPLCFPSGNVHVSGLESGCTNNQVGDLYCRVCIQHLQVHELLIPRYTVAVHFCLRCAIWWSVLCPCLVSFWVLPLSAERHIEVLC